MKRSIVLLAPAVACLSSACSDSILRAESGNREADRSLPLLRDSPTVGLVLALVLLGVAVLAWLLLRKRSR